VIWDARLEGKMAGEDSKRRSASARALAKRLERVNPERCGSPANRLLAIGQDCAARLKEPYRSIDHGELLYNDVGLPPC